MLRATPLVRVNAPVTSNVPLLLMASVPPLSKTSAPLPAVKVPPMLNVPLLISRTASPPFMVALWPEGILSVPLVRKSVPLPAITKPPPAVVFGIFSVPPDQVNKPVEVRLLVPVIAPPESVTALAEIVFPCAASVPAPTFSAPLSEAAPLNVSDPPVTCRVEPAAVVSAPATSVPAAETVNPAPMETASPAMGIPRLQFPEVSQAPVVGPIQVSRAAA